MQGLEPKLTPNIKYPTCVYMIYSFCSAYEPKIETIVILSHKIDVIQKHCT